MRKQESKLGRNLVTIFIVVLMVGSVMGYMFGRDSGEVLKYNEYKFSRTNNKFILKVNKQDVAFDYFPSDVEDIEINPEILDKLSNKIEIDSTYDNNSKFKEGISVAQYDLDIYFDIVGIHFVKGLTTENNYGLVIIECEDATPNVPVLYFKESNETKVWIKDDCIIAEAKNEFDIIRIKDRLIYGLYGIIENE